MSALFSLWCLPYAGSHPAVIQHLVGSPSHFSFISNLWQQKIPLSTDDGHLSDELIWKKFIRKLSSCWCGWKCAFTTIEECGFIKRKTKTGSPASHPSYQSTGNKALFFKDRFLFVSTALALVFCPEQLILYKVRRMVYKFSSPLCLEELLALLEVESGLGDGETSLFSKGTPVVKSTL